MPVLDMYKGLFFLNLGMAVLIVVAAAEILLNRGRFEFNREFLFFMGVLIALNILDGFLEMNRTDIIITQNNTLYMCVFALTGSYFLRRSTVDSERFFKLLSAFGVVSCLFIFLQYLLYLRGTVLYGFIPGLQLEKAATTPWEVAITYGRPTSFFREPAHFAIYILPIYTLCLFRRKFILSAIYLAGLVVSTSSTGLFGALVVSGIFIAREKRIPIIIKWVLAIIGVVLLIQFIPTLGQSSVVEKLRFVNIASNVRVFGTLPYFLYYGVKELFFGVGLNQLAGYVKLFTAQTIENYANSLFFSFFSFGLIGGSVWTFYMVRLHRLSRFKMLYLVAILVYLSDAILFNRQLFYTFLLLYVFADRKEDAPAVGLKP